MKINTTINSECSLARPLGAEDVRRGQYVSVLDEFQEWPSFLWNSCEVGNDPSQNALVRVRVKSPRAGIPLKVRSICLPFIQVQSPDRQTEVLDLRKVQLVLLTDDYAKGVLKGMEKSRDDLTLKF
jgi:hypothetical protein